MSGSVQCPHSDLHFHLNNVGMGNTNLHYLEITASCNICKTRMLWRGVPMGIGPNGPGVSVDGFELRLPMIGEGEELTGKPVGFSIRLDGQRS